MDKFDQLLDHYNHAVIEYWKGRCPPTKIDEAKAALKAHCAPTEATPRKPDGYAVVMDDKASAPRGYWFVACYTDRWLADQVAEKTKSRVETIQFAAPERS